MSKELFLLPERLKALREQLNMTQSDLARRLGLTRSSVNGWEMGISLPSTPIIVELAKIFHVSSDYLLGLEENSTISIRNLSCREVAALSDIVECFLENKNR